MAETQSVNKQSTTCMTNVALALGGILLHLVRCHLYVKQSLVCKRPNGWRPPLGRMPFGAIWKSYRCPALKQKLQCSNQPLLYAIAMQSYFLRASYILYNSLGAHCILLYQPPATAGDHSVWNFNIHWLPLISYASVRRLTNLFGVGSDKMRMFSFFLPRDSLIPLLYFYYHPHTWSDRMKTRNQ